MGHRLGDHHSPVGAVDTEWALLHVEGHERDHRLVVDLELDELVRPGGVQPELEAAARMILPGDEQCTLPARHVDRERLGQGRSVER